MWIAETLRNQNYEWLIFNKNFPTNLWWWGVQEFADEEYNNLSPIEAAAKSITNMRNATRQRTNQQVISDMINSQQSFFWRAIANRDSATSKAEMKAAQLDAFAAIVKWSWLERWDEDWNDYNTSNEIIKHYLEVENPDNDPEFNRKLIDYSNSEDNPYDFALDMWVLLTDDERKIIQLQNELDSMFWTSVPSWVAKTLKKWDDFWNVVWGWLSSRVDFLEKWDFNELGATYDSDEAPIIWAIENYAFRTFWKHIQNLDEYEMNKVLIDLQDYDTLKKYLPNEATAIANRFEWGVYWVLTNLYPEAALSLEMIWEVPIVWDITSWTLSAISTVLWAILANSILSPVWIPMELNLNNWEERKDFYEALWWAWIWYRWVNWKKSNTRWWRWWWIKNTINNFKEMLNTTLEDGKTVLNKLYDFSKWLSKRRADKKAENGKKIKKLNTKRLNEAWEIKWWLWNPADREKIANATKEITNINKIDSAEALAKERDTAKKRIWEEKTQLLDKNEKTYWVDDLDYIESNKSEEPVSTRPFEKALEKMIEDETNPVKKSDFENYQKKIKEWKITHRELEELIADFDKKYADSTYTKEWERKPNLSARERDDLRRWMRKRSLELADESWVENLTSDALSDLNKRYWDTTRAENIARTLDKKVKALQERLNSQPRYKKVLRGVWYVPLKILDVTWLLDLWRALLSEWWKEKSRFRNALETEKIIKDKLKSIDKINKMLDKEASPDVIIKWLQDEWLVSDIVEDSEMS